MVPRTLWESRDQSRETGLDRTGEAAGKNGADFRGETARVCRAEGTEPIMQDWPPPGGMRTGECPTVLFT